MDSRLSIIFTFSHLLDKSRDGPHSSNQCACNSCNVRPNNIIVIKIRSVSWAGQAAYLVKR
jgi:hypothetical protein